MQDFAVLGNSLLPKPKFLILKQLLASVLSNSQSIQCVIDRHVNPTHLASRSEESQSTKLICMAK